MSVVIPAFNAADTLGEQLDALVRQGWSGEWEVIIADNGSTDDTLAVVEQARGKLPNLRVVDASARPGVAFARNVGAAAATGDAILCCDADDIVGEGYLGAMAKALSLHDFVAARFDTNLLNPPWVQAGHSNPQRKGLQNYHYPPYLPHAGGSSLGIKRRLFMAVGGFDELAECLEDTDLCWRLQLAGTNLHFVPDAVIHVRFRDDPAAAFRQARAWGHGNVWLYRKYRAHGMPALTWRNSLHNWWQLARKWRLLRTAGGRLRWIRHLGWRWGRLEASVKYRVWAF